MLNNVSLTGRLVKDIDLRYTQAGTGVGSFTLAVDRNFKDKQGNYQTDFISCQVWGKRAEAMSNNTHKGSLIGVTGSIETGSYENKQGQKVYTTDVNVSDFTFLESRNASQQVPAKQADPIADNGTPIDVDSSDLPF